MCFWRIGAALSKPEMDRKREGAKTRASVASAGLHCGQYSEASMMVKTLTVWRGSLGSSLPLVSVVS